MNIVNRVWKTSLAVAFAVAMAPALGLGGDKLVSPTTQPAVRVRIENFAFDPPRVVVAVGATVTWTNTDDVPHTVTAKGEAPAFDSGAVDTDEKFSFTFAKAGVYSYYCKVHPHMTGTVEVRGN